MKRRRMPSYARQTVESPNPIARFAHRKRYEASLRVTEAVCRSGATLLDYGCGDGTFLRMLASRRPDVRLLGYDPYAVHDGVGYVKVESLTGLGRVADVVTCLETLEHLDDDEAAGFLAQLGTAMRPGGCLVVSVPIIGGPTLLLKEVSRVIMHRRRSDYRVGELLAAAAMGRPAQRPADIKSSHKGWDFRDVLPMITAASFDCVRTVYSPFERLPWWLNSQIIYVFRQA
jgi:2-polyprenyl-3-methyl-5-hydroxy-6-metoxy-1,4-benzoquinol methylase